MTIVDLVKQGKFVISAEVGPPKGLDIQEMIETAELMRGRVDAINVTDQQSSVMRLGSLATCCLLKEKGMEPVFQITCSLPLTTPKLVRERGYQEMRYLSDEISKRG